MPSGTILSKASLVSIGMTQNIRWQCWELCQIRAPKSDSRQACISIPATVVEFNPLDDDIVPRPSMDKEQLATPTYYNIGEMLAQLDRPTASSMDLPFFVPSLSRRLYRRGVREVPLRCVLRSSWVSLIASQYSQPRVAIASKNGYANIRYMYPPSQPTWWRPQQPTKVQTLQCCVPRISTKNFGCFKWGSIIQTTANMVQHCISLRSQKIPEADRINTFEYLLLLLQLLLERWKKGTVCQRKVPLIRCTRIQSSGDVVTGWSFADPKIGSASMRPSVGTDVLRIGECPLLATS